MDANDKAVLAEIRQDVKGLLIQGGVHNELLRTHEARSLSLQKQQEVQAARILPLEKQHDVVKWVLGAFGTLGLAVLGKLLLSALHLI